MKNEIERRAICYICERFEDDCKCDTSTMILSRIEDSVDDLKETVRDLLDEIGRAIAVLIDQVARLEK